MIEAVLLTMTQNWSSSSKIADKKNYLIGQHVYVIFCSGLELIKCHNAVSKHLGILLNIRRSDNNARALVKIASSAGIIVCLVGVSVNCVNLYL